MPIQNTPFPNPIQLLNLDGSNGFKIDGEAANDNSGRSVASAGDVNADGVDDLLIGAHGANPGGSKSGRSYVVFGEKTPNYVNQFTFIEGATQVIGVNELSLLGGEEHQGVYNE